MGKTKEGTSHVTSVKDMPCIFLMAPLMGSQIVRLLCLKLLLCCHIKRRSIDCGICVGGKLALYFLSLSQWLTNQYHSVGIKVKGPQYAFNLNMWESRLRRGKILYSVCHAVYLSAGDLSWISGSQSVCLPVAYISICTAQQDVGGLDGGWAKNDFILIKRFDQFIID